MWDELNRAVGGRLIRVASPLEACAEAPSGEVCRETVHKLKNPYYLGDEPGLTQTLGWAGAWVSQPSVYAVSAETTADVVAAVNFASKHNLRLVVKGGGHSYQGTSNAPGSLLIWTRKMNAIALHDAFIAAGCEGRQEPAPAVTVEAGAMWGHAYDAVTTKAGRYVQGGGCLTVGVAGLVQSGGFGSFSKNYGLAAASLLEAEIVTTDGRISIANACANPNLFWAIRGGGGGSFGVVTRLTLRTHELPKTFGAVFAMIRAKSDAAYNRLIVRTMHFYRDGLHNPHWGEQIGLRPDNVLAVSMLFQGLEQQEAEAVWQPFFNELAAMPDDYSIAEAPQVLALPAQRLWDPEFLKAMPGIALADDRPGASPSNIFWAGDQGQAGQFLHGYDSAWLPASLLRGEAIERLADGLFAASRHWSLSLHFNKGLAGGSVDAIASARDTAMNPAVLDAFALVILGAEQPPAYPGIAGREPDLTAARRHADAIGRAMSEIRRIAPDSGSYVAESNFFNEAWRDAFWGSNYARLLAIKDEYDPSGLFFVHHGVGSERWSADGFTRLE
jgi:FAD/FMN-containing dehydrogenase